MIKKIFFTFLILLFFVFSFQVFAHSGRTDSNGGHYDHSDGSYHYHHGEPAHDHPNGECPYIKANQESEETKSSKTLKIIMLCSTPLMALFPTAILLCVISPIFNFLSNKINLLNKHYNKIETCLYIFLYIIGATLWVVLILNTC